MAGPHPSGGGFGRICAGHRTVPRGEATVEAFGQSLIGRKPELRFAFIQENAEFATADLDV